MDSPTPWKASRWIWGKITKWSRSASIRGIPGNWRSEEVQLRREVSAQGRGRGLAFSGWQGRHGQEAGRHGGLPLQVRSDLETIRTRQRHHGADTGRQAVTLFLRHRI